MPTQFITAILTIIFLIVFWAVFLFFYFRSIKSEIGEYWLLVLEKLRRRLDKIPGVIEEVRLIPGIDQAPINELIKIRSICWPNSEPEKAKIHCELNISEKIHWIWELAKQHPELNKSMVYMGAKREFKEIGGEIEKMLEEYNKKVRHYNKLRNFILLRPFLFFLHYKKMVTFEFEP